MKATRRSFLAALASIPFLRRFVPRGPEMFQETTVYSSWDPRLHANVFSVNGRRLTEQDFRRWVALDPWHRTYVDIRDEDLA